MKKNTHIPEEKELEKLAPTLFGIKKENPFSVPENYFDSLSLQIRDKIQEENSKLTLFERIFAIKSEFTGWKVFLNPRVSLSAVTLILLMVFGLKLFLSSGQQQNLPIASHQNTDSGISPLLEYIDEELIIDAISDASCHDTKKAPASDKDATDKKAIEDYLLNNTSDVTLISNEL